MATNKPSARGRRRLPPADAPIVVMPKQTTKDIESRQRIREALHDAKAITIKSQRSNLKSQRSMFKSQKAR